MIEVEIRGRLNASEFAKLQKFLQANGEHIESQDREMYLLYDYPGYDHDSTTRDVDIRLRNTNGKCEIMVKQKVSDHNVGRKETALKLQDTDLETAKQVVKAFGCDTALKMHRIKDVYNFNDIEWSLVKCPKDIFYFEAEKEVDDGEDLNQTQEDLTQEAKKLDLEVLGPEAMKEFIAYLDNEVNEEVEL